VLPTFEAMLRGGDRQAREAALIAIGDLPGAGEAGARLLGESLGQRSEALRTAAAHALGHMAEHDPGQAVAFLERAVRDPSYDVRNAAVPGLARAYARLRSADDLGRVLVEAEADSTRRFVALEALVLKAQGPGDASKAEAGEKARARQALDRAVTDASPPLAHLAAQIGRTFLDAPPAELHLFIERLLGG
jgi:hypothetical protein